ncbi:hypothetical protein F5Y18DRAFT_429025 [Xylariaceae sp. FL1019]|nr:hypothetical protein F5Y18DRAFT_429025 [Xylariaceae sp. FL1019]
MASHSKSVADDKNVGDGTGLASNSDAYEEEFDVERAALWVTIESQYFRNDNAAGITQISLDLYKSLGEDGRQWLCKQWLLKMQTDACFFLNEKKRRQAYHVYFGCEAMILENYNGYEVVPVPARTLRDVPRPARMLRRIPPARKGRTPAVKASQADDKEQDSVQKDGVVVDSNTVGVKRRRDDNKEDKEDQPEEAIKDTGTPAAMIDQPAVKKSRTEPVKENQEGAALGVLEWHQAIFQWMDAIGDETTTDDPDGLGGVDDL